ncbi:hypothetical protein BDN70DRAFT_930777 [Pholiota conissans]|uniref:Uncharacterized protein n=1 Tax=Pholiota conissans TaxID=109636 RepID=A0A9P6D2L6_9AGAR|nr:hypothetical protein BDN70DRAFT_930777 [Pholiota conissans]
MPVPDSYHLFHPNPYPPPPPPPALAHKVWILDCRSCGKFLTNRGMKAVLLLRPNVSLYSSDALPVNCSAYSPAPAAPLPASHKPPAAQRTCECLTQSLACHGCGNTIGYMIVYPCPRCTASISATNRATNGHRFVFHSNEVTGTERRYITDEPGVIPYDPPLYHDYPAPPFVSRHPRPASPVFRADYLPTPPLEFATPSFVAHSPRAPAYDSAPQYPNFRSRALPSRSPPPLPPLRYAHASPPANPDGDDDLDDEDDGYATPSGSPPPPAHFNSNAYLVDHKEPQYPVPSLKRGDVVFWHHLARTGEISSVAHDERARRPPTPPRSRPILFNR